MSTVSSDIPNKQPRKSRDTASATDELTSHLRRTASFIKIFDLMIECFTWLGGMAAAWLTLCLVDHWLLPLSPVLRWLAWLAIVGITAYVAFRRILPLLLGKINLDYAAKRIERAEPQFKEGLIAWLQLSRRNDSGVPRGVMSALTYRAYRFIGGQDPSSTVDSSPLIRSLAAFLVLSLVMILYSFVSPKSSLATAQRVAMPWRDVAPPTRVKISDILPGNAVITSGKPLPISVRCNGLLEGEPLQIVFSTRDGQFVDQAITLAEPDVGSLYEGELRTTKRGIEHELEYWIEAGDARSERYSVELSPVPTLTLERVELVYPAYTDLPKRISDGKDIEAVEGTRAKFVLRASQPLERAQLEINPQLSEEGKTRAADHYIAAEIDGLDVAADWLFELEQAGALSREVQYCFRGANERGDYNEQPVIHDLRVVRDVPPTVEILGPESRVLNVHPGTRLNLDIRASDPDYGLREVDLRIHKSGMELAKRTILEGEALKGKQSKKQPLDLRSLKLRPGDRIEIHASARDNRHAPRTNKWSPNETQATPLIIQVIARDKPADVPRQPAEDRREQPPGQGDSSESEPGSSGSEAKRNSDSSEGSSGQSGTQQPGGAGGGSESSSGDQSGAGSQGDAGQGNAGGESNAAENNAAQNNSSENNSGGQSGRTGGKSDGQSSSAGSSGQGNAGESNNDATTSGSTNNSVGSSSRSAESNSNAGSSNAANGNATEGAGQSSGNNAGRATSSTSPRSASGSGNQSPANSSSGAAEAIDKVREYMQQNNAQPSENGQSPTGQSQQSPSSASGNSQDGSGSSSQEQSGNGGQQEQSGEPGASSGDQSDSNPMGTSKSGKQPDANQQNGNQSAGNQADGNQSQDGNGGEPSSTSKNGSGETGNNGQSAPKDANSGQPSSQTADSNDSGSGSAGQPSQSASNQGNQSQNSGSQNSGSQLSSDQPGNSGNSAPSGNPSNSQSGNSQSGQGQANNGESGAGSNTSSTSADSSQSSGGDQGGGTQKSNSKNAAGQERTEANNSENTGNQKTSDNETGNNETGDQGNSAGSNGDQSGSGSGGGQSAPPENAANSQRGSEENDAGQSSNSGSQSSSSASSSAASSSSTQSQSSGGQPGSSGKPSSSGEGTTPTGSGASSGIGNAGDTAPAISEAVDRDAAERSADMVLDYLDRQRDQPDPELLREVNWTERDLNQFVDRWKSARDLADKGEPSSAKKWEELLDALQLKSATTGRLDRSRLTDDFRQMSDSIGSRKVPRGLKKRWEAFQRATQNN